MKTLVKGLAALMICGTIIGFNCERTEASEIPDLTSNAIDTEDLSKRFPVPPRYGPPPRHRDRFENFPPPPPPHSSRHEGRYKNPPPPPPPPHHGGRHGHYPPPPPRW